MKTRSSCKMRVCLKISDVKDESAAQISPSPSSTGSRALSNQQEQSKAKGQLLQPPFPFISLTIISSQETKIEINHLI